MDRYKADNRLQTVSDLDSVMEKHSTPTPKEVIKETNSGQSSKKSGKDVPSGGEISFSRQLSSNSSAKPLDPPP